jgi:hypothetical protein
VSGFSTTPAELHAASASLQAARAELVGGRGGGIGGGRGGGIGGGTGAGALDSALSYAAARAALTAQLLSAAATVSARNLAAGADAYTQTDGAAVPQGWV